MIQFQHYEVSDLAWAFQGPGLLDPNQFQGRCLSDTDLREIFRPYLKNIESLNNDPAPLIDFLKAHPNGGRLGRYFENLFLFFFTHLKSVSHLKSNLQIRDGKKTIGELDFIFRETSSVRPIHIEVSVKFYICIARTLEESLDSKFFVGTLIEDRLDRKLTKIFDQQVQLPLSPVTCAQLEELNLARPISLGLMKGCFYYPSETDWQNHPHPMEVSETHHRGWWTTAKEPLVPQKSPDSRYIVMPFDRWLTPFNGPAAPFALYTLSELHSFISRVFDSSWARPRHFELGVAEVEVINENPLLIREVSRGNILHPKWPAHARGE